MLARNSGGRGVRHTAVLYCFVLFKLLNKYN